MVTFKTLICGLAVVCSISASAAVPGTHDVSFANEIKHAIDKGLDWLTANQKTNGSWSTTDHPAVTALALEAFMGEPSGKFQRTPSVQIRKGYQFILSN